MKWIESGIPAFEEHIPGYPKGKTTLIVGSPGSGKTIMALHNVDKAISNGKKVYFIATEETPEDIIDQAESLGLSNVVIGYKQGNLKIRRVFEDRVMDLASFYLVDFNKVSRDFILLTKDLPEDTDIVIIDNISVFCIGLTPDQFRDQIDHLRYELSKKNFTSIVIADESLNEKIIQIAMYSSYAAIRVYKRENTYTGKIERIMDVVKIRNGPSPKDNIIYDITEKGIEILGIARR